MHIHTDTPHRPSRRSHRKEAHPPRRKALPLCLSMALAAGAMVSPGVRAGSAVPGANAGTVSVAALTSPTGGSVVGGVGSISQSGGTTVINQLSNKLALDWQTFNVGKDATVLFKQPSFTAVALNRILDQNPSQIFGRINSNGQVFLINTHGIIFGTSAQVNVGGLVASTLDLTPSDFLANHFNLDAHGGSAGVVNHGTIAAASGGSVSLLGGSVANDGLILANYGNINLDGADRAVLDFDGNGLITVEVTGALKQRLDDRAAVSNSGTLEADGGTVVLQASAAKDLFTDAVNNSGVITAGGISTDGGTVRLVAAGGNAINSGSINVSGVHGGTAQVLSDANVGVTGSIDASGTRGGGIIRVGGGWQGGEGLTTAGVTYLGPDAVLDADATQRGNGGSVVLWGNDGNNFYGSISARGGALGGDGGRVETSSHYGLNVQGSVDASAANGAAGNWLIDPHNVTIQSGAGSLVSPFTATADSSTIKASDLEAALNGTNVTIFTGSTGTTQGGDITVNAAITPSAGNNSLYLEAAGSIFLNANITANTSHTLNLYLWSNYGGAAAGTTYTSNASCAVSCVVTVGDTSNAAISTGGGTLDIRTGTGGGALTLGTGSKTGTINTGGGALTVHTTGITEVAGSNTIVSGATTLDAGSGNITLGNANDFTGTVGLTAGNAQIEDANSLVLGNSTLSGSLTATAVTAITVNGAITGVGDTAFSTAALSGTGSIAGTGAITGLGSSNFALTGANAGTYGGIAFSGFTSADATHISGAAGFDDTALTSEGMTFASATHVAGSGTIANVGGSFADDTGTSTTSGIAYTGFGTVTGTGGDVTGVTGNFNLGTQVSSASGLDYSGFTLATVAGSGSGATLVGSGQTYTLDDATADKGSNGSIAWTGFGNIQDSAGTVVFGIGGSVSGNVTAKTLDYSSYGSAVNFDLSAGGGTTTGIGGSWSGVTSVTGSSAGDTIAGSNQTYTLTGANAGNNGTVSWTSFENIADTAAGTVAFDAGGSLGGNATVQTLDYSSYGSAVNFDLSAGGGTTTGIGGSWSGVTSVTGSSAGDTIAGNNQTYTLTGANAGNNGAVSWTSFENIADSGTGTLKATGATFNLSGGNSGTVTTLLPGGFSGIGSIQDSTGSVVFGAGGGVSGNVTAKTLDYGSYGSAVNFDLSAGGGATTGIGGIWSGVTSVTGSSVGDTIAGNNQTYTLTGANAGNNGTVSWTSFENIADSGTGTLQATGATFNLSGGNSGTVTTLLPGGFSGIGSIQDSTGSVVFGAGGGVSGNVTAQTLDYSSYGSAVNFDLSAGGGTTSGIGGSWIGVTSVTGSSAGDTIAGSNQTYTLTGANAGNNGTVSWTSFENIADSTAGTVAFNAGGSLGGNASVQTLDYSNYGSAVNFDLSAGSGTTTGIGGSWSGVTAVAGSSAGDTIAGSNQTYTLTGANAGNNGTVSWTSFENIADSGTGTLKATGATFNLSGGNSGTVTTLLPGGFSGIGNLDDATGTVAFGAGGSLSGNVTAKTLDYGSYGSAVNFDLSAGGGATTGIGGIWSGVFSVTGSSVGDTIAGNNQTYTLTGANAGNNGTVSWTSFENIADSGTGTLKATGATFNLSGGNSGTVTTLLPGGFSGIGNLDDATGTVAFGAGGSLSGNVTAKTMDYSSYGSAVNFDLSAGGGTTTGIGGSWSGVTSVTGSSAGDTIAGSNQTYTLTGANAGNNGTVSWTSFENIDDTAAGTVAFDAGGSLGGNATVQTLDYSSYGSAVNFDLSAGSGATTGIGGIWSGVFSVTGSSVGDTIAGNNQTYTLTGANAGNNGTVSWTSFENIADSGTGTLQATGATFNLSGGNSGTVTTLLPGGFSGIGSIQDSTGSVVFGAGGGVSGNVTAQTLDYSSYGSAVNFDLSAGGGTTSGIGGSWIGVTSVTGSSAGDTIAGSNQTYTLTGANAGNNGTVSWTSFENIADSGTGTLQATGATFNLSGGNSGTVTTLLPGGFSGIGNLDDATGTVAFGTGGSLSGNVTAKTLDYSSYGSAVNFDLSAGGGATTGIGGIWSGVTSVTGSSVGDTIAGNNQTYTLTGANAGNNGTVSWTSFENIADSGTGTLQATGATFNLSGGNSGTVTTLLPGGFSGIGSIQDSTGSVVFGAGGGVSGNVTAQTLDYSSYGSAVNFDLSAGGGTTSGIGGSWSGVTSVTGSSAGDTIAGSNQTYTLTGANAGNNGTVSWTSFENIDDTAAGTVAFDAGGSLGGNATVQTLDYSNYGSAVNFDLSAGSGATTGIGGIWSGVFSVTGSSVGDTIAGNNQTYTLTGANAGNNGTVSWTSFENIADSGTGTLQATGATFNLSGGNSGTVTTLLPGGFSGIGSIQDSTGSVVFGAGGGVSGNVTAKTLDYSSYGSAVNLDLSAGGGATTGIGGSWSGVTSVTGSSAGDTIAGSNQTYTLTGANAGNNGAVSWTSFENIADSGTGTLQAANQSWSLTGHNHGNVTDLSGTFSGIGNLTDTGTGAFLMHSGADGDISGNLDAGTGGSLDYTGYGTAVNVNLSGAGTTGVGGTVSGIASITASSNLGVSGTTAGSLDIATAGGGTTTTLGTLSTGTNLTVNASGAVLQSGALTVTGATTVNAGSNAIKLTDSGNDFQSWVNLTGGTTQITDQNALTLGTLSTGALTVISHGTVNLGHGNVGGNLAATSNNATITEGSGGVQVMGTSNLQAGTGAITLTDSSNHFTGAVTAAGQDVSLVDAGNLTVASLNSGTNGTVNLTAGGALVMPGALSGANVTLSGRDGITLGSNLTSAGTVTLTSSSGAISQTGGVLTAGTLTGSSAGDTTLGDANHIGTLGSFSAADFTLTNAQALTIGSNLVVGGGTGSIALTTTSGGLTVQHDLNGGAIMLNSAGNLSLAGNLAGSSVDLVSGGDIAQSAGVIQTGTLTGQAGGSATLARANKIGTLGNFSASNGLSISNGQALTVGGTVNGGSSTSLTTTSGSLTTSGSVGGSSIALAGQGGLAIDGAVNAGTGDITLGSAAGAISEGSGGVLTAGSLSGTSSGSTTLDGANQVVTLGNFTTGGDFSFRDARTLTVNSPLDVHGGGGNLSLTTSGASSDLILGTGLAGGTVKLIAGRNITTSSGITATTLTGSAGGQAQLGSSNHVGTLGDFSASSLSFGNAGALVVGGQVSTGSGALDLSTTAGNLRVTGAVTGGAVGLTSASALAIDGTVSASTLALQAAGAITQSGGAITASSLTGTSGGSTTLDGANHVGSLGSFSAAGFRFTNAGALSVTGPIDGGSSTRLATTSGDLVINGQVSGTTTTTLVSAGAITEGSAGRLVAGTLAGQSSGTTTLGGSNSIDTLGSFSASGLSLTNGKALSVGGPVNGGASASLTTTSGDLAVDGQLSATAVWLQSAGAITEGSGGVITASTLSGQSGGLTTLGSQSQAIGNQIDTLGNFSSTAGFSLTNGKTLTLASVDNSAFTVDAGHAELYLGVTQGDLLEQGKTPLYDGTGTFASAGHMGSGSSPIYVIGDGAQLVAHVGEAPAYFYAVDRQGNILPLTGELSFNVPTSLFFGKAQNGNGRGDAYIDPSVISANYRSFGIVPSGILLPADQQACDPGVEDCGDQ